MILLHSGAGALADRSYARELAHMSEVADAAWREFRGGRPALEIAVAAVEEMERCGLYVAGRGASANSCGEFELDAGIMDGASGRIGSVATLTGVMSPIQAALRVMTRTPHVLFAGQGAADFAAAQKLPLIEQPSQWFTPAQIDDDNHAPPAMSCGTVGCVVRDTEGRLASATSTGGVFAKPRGRVGDTPIAGAGFWADDRVAVCCTGQGELFVRVAAAVQVAHRMRWAGEDVDTAVCNTLGEVRRLGGYGGIVAVSANGECAMRSVGTSMRFAMAGAGGEIAARVI